MARVEHLLAIGRGQKTKQKEQSRQQLPGGKVIRKSATETGAGAWSVYVDCDARSEMVSGTGGSACTGMSGLWLYTTCITKFGSMQENEKEKQSFSISWKLLGVPVLGFPVEVERCLRAFLCGKLLVAKKWRRNLASNSRPGI